MAQTQHTEQVKKKFQGLFKEPQQIFQELSDTLAIFFKHFFFLIQYIADPQQIFQGLSDIFAGFNFFF